MDGCSGMTTGPHFLLWCSQQRPAGNLMPIHREMARTLGSLLGVPVVTSFRFYVQKGMENIMPKQLDLGN